MVMMEKRSSSTTDSKGEGVGRPLNTDGDSMLALCLEPANYLLNEFVECESLKAVDVLVIVIESKCLSEAIFGGQRVKHT